MEVDHGYIWKVTILLEGPIFDFHILWEEVDQRNPKSYLEHWIHLNDGPTSPPSTSGWKKTMEHGGISLNYLTPKKGRKKQNHKKKPQGFLLNESGTTNSVVHVLPRKEHLNITTSRIFKSRKSFIFFGLVSYFRRLYHSLPSRIRFLFLWKCCSTTTKTPKIRPYDLFHFAAIFG